MHVSAYTLDELALGALDHDAEHAVRTHLDACERCRGEHDTAAALRAHFMVAVLPRTQPHAPRRRWWWLAVPMLALAALTVVLIRPTHEVVPELAIKGDATWQLFANRDGKTFAVKDGAVLGAGDRVRFVVTPVGARYLLVVSVDGAGATSVYYPYGGTTSAALDGSAHVELPGSIVLDSAPGPERMYALFSDEPIDVATVQDQLRSIGASAAAIRTTHALTAKVRAQASLVFEKAPP